MKTALGEGALTLLSVLKEVESLTADAAARAELGDALTRLRREVVRYETEKYALRCDLEALDAEVSRLRSALAQSRRRASDAAGLYVATHRLHATLDRGQVLQAVEDIVASLLGCEQMAVFEMSGSPPLLVPVSVRGLPPGRLESVRPGEGIIGRAVQSGELWLAGEGAAPAGERPALSACVPLKVDGEVTGALALYALLEHRERLGADDRELLELLSTHAATALYASRLRRRGWDAAS
jgi:GAF domain-containing protein